MDRQQPAAVLHERVERLALGVVREQLVVAVAQDNALELVHRLRREERRIVRDEALQAVRREVPPHLLRALLGRGVVERALGDHFAGLLVLHPLPPCIDEHVNRPGRGRDALLRVRGRKNRGQYRKHHSFHFLLNLSYARFAP